jgi:hypothetical protein
MLTYDEAMMKFSSIGFDLDTVINIPDDDYCLGCGFFTFCGEVKGKKKAECRGYGWILKYDKRAKRFKRHPTCKCVYPKGKQIFLVEEKGNEDCSEQSRNDSQ